jgi:hypothetical protein
MGEMQPWKEALGERELEGQKGRYYAWKFFWTYHYMHVTSSFSWVR